MNLDTLTQAVSAESPGGDDLTFSNEFDRIQEMRREDDPSLDQGEWVTELKVADWPGVVALCESLLCTRSKDLRVAGWWADAQARLHGFAGLADGLALCASLCETHWDHLYPLIEEGDIEPRVGNVTWLLGRVEQLSRLARVLPGPAGRTLSLADVDAAKQKQAAVARGETDAAAVRTAGGLLMEDVQREVSRAGRAVFEERLQAVETAKAALARLQIVVDARLGADGPGFSAARKSLDDALSTLARLGRDSGVLSAASAEAGEAAAGADAGATTTGGGALAGGSPQTRTQALQQLRVVADFFRRTEPHSPVAYLADKAARWGEMPLHAWLRQVVKDGGSLAHLEEMLGVDPPPAPPT